MGFIALTFWGANMGLNGYLPLYLRNVGWTPSAADGAMTALLAAGLGVIPMVLVAQRLNSQKGVFVFSLCVMTISLALIPVMVVRLFVATTNHQRTLRSGFPAC
jgi:multisubunit Na+/H+ antiporter MnhB subunit